MAALTMFFKNSKSIFFLRSPTLAPCTHAVIPAVLTDETQLKGGKGMEGIDTIRLRTKRFIKKISVRRMTA